MQIELQLLVGLDCKLLQAGCWAILQVLQGLDEPEGDVCMSAVCLLLVSCAASWQSLLLLAGCWHLIVLRLRYSCREDRIRAQERLFQLPMTPMRSSKFKHAAASAAMQLTVLAPHAHMPLGNTAWRPAALDGLMAHQIFVTPHMCEEKTGQGSS